MYRYDKIRILPFNVLKIYGRVSELLIRFSFKWNLKLMLLRELLCLSEVIICKM